MTKAMTAGAAKMYQTLIDDSATMTRFYIREINGAAEERQTHVADLYERLAHQHAIVIGHFGRLIIAARGVHRPDSTLCDCADCIERIGAEGTYVH